MLQARAIADDLFVFDSNWVVKNNRPVQLSIKKITYFINVLWCYHNGSAVVNFNYTRPKKFLYINFKVLPFNE